MKTTHAHLKRPEAYLSSQIPRLFLLGWALLLILCCKAENAHAFQNRISLMPGYTISFYDDVGLSAIDGIYGPIGLTYFEFDSGNQVNFVAEMSATWPSVSGDSGTFDDLFVFYQAGAGFKYYPRLRGTSDFRLQGDTAVLITSQYVVNPYVGTLVDYEIFSEDSYARRKRADNDPAHAQTHHFMRGNRTFYGFNLITGCDLVLSSQWGLTFLMRYTTRKSVNTINSSNLLVMGISLHAGIYLNF